MNILPMSKQRYKNKDCFKWTYDKEYNIYKFIGIPSFLVPFYNWKIFNMFFFVSLLLLYVMYGGFYVTILFFSCLFIPALPNTLAHCSLEDNRTHTKKTQPKRMRACQGRGIFSAILCWFYKFHFLFVAENRIVHLWKLFFLCLVCFQWFLIIWSISWLLM